MIKVHSLFIIFNVFAITYSNSISESRETAITRAIKLVGPSVASINVEQHTPSVSFDPFFGLMYPKDIYPMKNSGSGVVISPDGFLITNYHVVENALNINLTIHGNTLVRVGKVVTVKIPYVQTSTVKKDEPFDKFYNGPFLIKRIRHDFAMTESPQKHIMTMNLVKDSLEEELDGAGPIEPSTDWPMIL